MQHLGQVEAAGKKNDDGNDDELYYEDQDSGLEFESDEESGDDTDDNDNDIYDDELYGAKRPRLEDESIELTEEQKKVVENLKKKQKK